MWAAAILRKRAALRCDMDKRRFAYKGSEVGLLKYMEGSKKRFAAYQRSYHWKQENCGQLFGDLATVVRTERKSHFFGSIVSADQTNGRYAEHLVVDGQQRLTPVWTKALVDDHEQIHARWLERLANLTPGFPGDGLSLRRGKMGRRDFGGALRTEFSIA